MIGNIMRMLFATPLLILVASVAAAMYAVSYLKEPKR